MDFKKKIFIVSFIVVLLITFCPKIYAIEGGFSHGPSKRSNAGQSLNKGFSSTKTSSSSHKKVKSSQAQPKTKKQNQNYSQNKSNKTVNTDYIENQNINTNFDIKGTTMPTDAQIWEVINKYDFDKNQKDYLFRETKKRLQQIYSNAK